MMNIHMEPVDEYYHYKEEPLKSTLQAARELILQLHPEVTEAWKYRMPFFCYRGKMFCYCWISTATGQPYIGFVEGRQMDHPQLLQEARARMKIFMLEAGRPLPLKTLRPLLKQALVLTGK